jgi:hypothetical protein
MSEELNHYNQVYSVYFSIPGAILEMYGRLSEISAEWYEYRTKPIIVTSSSVLYDYAIGKIGVLADGLDISSNSRGVYYWPGKGTQYSFPVYRWNYYNVIASAGQGDGSLYLYWLFYNSDLDSDISSRTLSDWVRDYDGEYPHGGNFLPIKDGKSIVADLFEDSVDPGRTMGYNYFHITDEDLFDLDSFVESNDWWEQLAVLGSGFFPWDDILNDGRSGVEYIYKVEDEDLIGIDSFVAERLLIGEGAVQDFRAYYLTKKIAGESVYLFRYAARDYYSLPLDIVDNSSYFQPTWSGQAYMAQETVFFDFDIIDLTFNRSGAVTVIPVVSDPVDIIGDVVGGLFGRSFSELLKWILIILAAVLVLVIFFPFILPLILKGALLLGKLTARFVLFLCGQAARFLKFLVYKISGGRYGNP